MNVNAGIQVSCVVSLAVTCLLSGEFASQANLAGFTRDALTLALAQTGTPHALCSHSHSFKPLQIYVRISSASIQMRWLWLRWLIHPPSTTRQRGNGPTGRVDEVVIVSNYGQMLLGAGLWSSRRLPQQTRHSGSANCNVQLWSVWWREPSGRRVVRDLDFETVQVSWAPAVEAKLKSKTKPKTGWTDSRYLLSLGHRWRLVLSPIKRSLTAVGNLIVGGLSSYAYQVDSFKVLQFF